MISTPSHIETREEKLKKRIGSDRSEIYDQIKIFLEKTTKALKNAKIVFFEKKNYSSFGKVGFCFQKLEESHKIMDNAIKSFGRHAKVKVLSSNTSEWNSSDDNFKTGLNILCQPYFDLITSVLHEIEKDLKQIELFLNEDDNSYVWTFNDITWYKVFNTTLTSANELLVGATIDFEKKDGWWSRPY